MLRDSKPAPAFNPVHVVGERRGVRVIILEGLDVADVASLVRSLS